MSKEMKRELRKLRLKHDLIEKTDCTPEENSAFSETKAKGETLPENVFEYLGDDGTGNGTFYKVSDTGLTDAEKAEYIQLKQSRDITIIKNCTVFFAALAALGLTLTILNYIYYMM